MEPPAGALSSSLLTSFLLARGVDDVQSADGDLVIHATHPQPAAQPLAVAAPPTSVAMGAAAALPLSVPMMPAREYVLIMLGAPNTGKTALLTRYAEGTTVSRTARLARVTGRAHSVVGVLHVRVWVVRPRAAWSRVARVQCRHVYRVRRRSSACRALCG